MATAARAFDAVLAALVAAGYAVIVVVGFAHVLFRFVFQSSLSWSEELVRYIFVWSVFLTAALAFNFDSHIRVDFLTARYPPRLQRAMALISWGCVIVCVAILLVLGLQLMQAPSVRRQKSPAMEIPMSIPYAAIPVGCAAMLVNIARAVRRTWKGAPSTEVHVEAT